MGIRSARQINFNMTIHASRITHHASRARFHCILAVADPTEIVENRGAVKIWSLKHKCSKKLGHFIHSAMGVGVAAAAAEHRILANSRSEAVEKRLC